MRSEPNRVFLSIEVDESIYNCIKDFLAVNPQWNRDQVVNASMSLFLLQNHQSIKPTDYRACSRNYLNSVCSVPERYTHN